MGVRRHVDDPATARLRARCMALLLAPLVVILGTEVASRLLSAASSGTGTFVPEPWVMLLSVLLSACYAGGFTFLLSRLQRHRTDGFVIGWRGQSMSRWNVWAMGGLLFALLSWLTPMVFFSSINRVVGQATSEDWRVLGKEHNQVSHGCEWRVTVASRASDDASTRVCVTRARWEQLRADDSLTIAAVFSGLGSEIGAAPASVAPGGGQ